MTAAEKKIRELEATAHVQLVKLKTSMKPKAENLKKSLTSVSFLTLAVKTLALVLFYYAFSIGLTFYNQRFIKHWNYPLSLTMAHLVVKFMISALMRNLIECKTGKPRVILPWGVYCKRVAPAGITSALDIGLSNWSFEFITVSLYTMSKSTAVIFILFFALIMRLEKWRWSLVVVVLFIATGLFMFTYHSTQFNAEGFAMVMTASLLSGLRWTLAQVVMQKNELGLHNPLDTMYHIQPWMIVGLIPLSAGFEGIPLSTTDQFFRFSEYGVLLRNCGLVLLGALLAFMLEFSEYLLLSQTSSLTLSISGIFKEVCTLYIAHKVNGDTMNMVNGIGLIVCLVGITLHVVIKAVNNREKSLSSPLREDSIQMLKMDNTANISDDEDEEIYSVKGRLLTN
ncbi:solute carrier family 35 member C2-like [Dreissena polymorpha]|uniref:solute carrier family 35 member C2-like n=1 Tax=Dreissena polymorpha TaxID=45954 RepID=UPI002263CB2D|nr:solute carrier family 35 member C2-like [Dreissena polymorpha]